MVGTPLSHCQQPWISEGNENSNVWFVYKCRTFFICLVSSHVTSARTERPRSGRAAMIRQRNWKCSLLSSRMMIRCEKAVFDHHKPRHHARLGASRCEPCEYALQLTAGARRRGRGPAFSVEGGVHDGDAGISKACYATVLGNLLRAGALCLSWPWLGKREKRRD
jgi:hypothetical protein